MTSRYQLLLLMTSFQIAMGVEWIPNDRFRKFNFKLEKRKREHPVFPHLLFLEFLQAVLLLSFLWLPQRIVIIALFQHRWWMLRNHRQFQSFPFCLEHNCIMLVVRVPQFLLNARFDIRFSLFLKCFEIQHRMIDCAVVVNVLYCMLLAWE